MCRVYYRDEPLLTPDSLIGLSQYIQAMTQRQPKFLSELSVEILHTPCPMNQTEHLRLR